MALVVNTNMAALNAQRNLGISQSSLGKSIERLSSGLRINKAADDPAGIAIATKFSTQVRGLNQAARNANNAIALAQTAEGGINTVTNILHRLRELAVQSSSDDNTPADRANLALEADSLVAELTRTVNTTEYNTMPLLDGGFTSKYFQIGSNYGQTITFTINDSRGRSLGGRAEFSGDIADGVTNAVNGNFGASEFKINTYGVATTNASDDQYSVINLSSATFSSLMVSDLVSAAGLDSTGDADSGQSLRFTTRFDINGVSVSVMYSVTSAVASGAALTGTASAFATAVSFAADVVSAIANHASLIALNITARITEGGSAWVIERTDGGNLTVLASLNVSASGAAGVSIGTVQDSQWFSLIGAISLVSGTSAIGNGYDLTAATAPTTYNGESSAIAKAVAINAVKSDSGVQATAKGNIATAATAVVAGTITSGDIYINGVNIGAVTVTDNDSTGALITAINNQSSNTGVTATTDADNKLVLTAADGRNITLTVDTITDGTSTLGLASTYFTGTTAIFRSTVQLNDDETFALTGTLEDLYDAGTSDANNTTKTTDVSKSAAADVSTYNVAATDISTQDNAQAALLTIDAALDDINANRADLGAIQTRLEFAVANLQIASENMSASESRIRDADFAWEVGQFTRSQILMQAGVAMLAQSNTLPQVALQLLG